MKDTMKPHYRFILVNTTGIEADEIKQAFDTSYGASNLHQAIMALVKNVKGLIENPKGEYRIARLGYGAWRIDVYGLAIAISFSWSPEGFRTQ